MYRNNDLINYVRNFTEIYKKYSQDNIYLRETKCLEYQWEHILLPLRNGDLIAGRKCEMPVGFFPQCMSAGVGYHCDIAAMKKMQIDASPQEKETLTNLISFWTENSTTSKIRAEYDHDLKNLLMHDDYTVNPGIACPLYRISGAQMNPEKLLHLGIDGLIDEAKAYIARSNIDSLKNTDLHPGNADFYQGIVDTLLLLKKVINRYESDIQNMLLQEKNNSRYRELKIMANNLTHIASSPPDNFWQAIQLIWLFYLLSGAFNYGRMDDYMGEFLEKDNTSGMEPEDFPLVLVKNLWSLIIERETTWDARVVIGGKNRKNPAAADEFALLAIEASRQLRDIVPQLTLRLYDGLNPKVYDKALEAIGEGTTYPMLYNDEVNIPNVANAFSVDMKTAAEYIPFGCGEYVLYNQSFGTPSGTINLLHCLNSLIYDGEKNILAESSDFEDFYNRFILELEKYIFTLARQEKLEYDVCAKDAGFLFYSILFDDCMERGRPLLDGGVRYLGGTLETYGNTNTADSLSAIKSLVFNQKIITPEVLAAALRANFKGYEDIRKLLFAAPKFGNDDDFADSIAVRFHDDICMISRSCAKKTGLHSYLNVIINNSMNTTFGLTTGASADGRTANTYMANANNPTGGMDKNGITAMLNSLVKLKSDHHAGSVQNMRFSQEMFTRLLPKTKGILDVYFSNGGAQTMISVLNRDDLEKALEEPEKYKNLIVRVGGFSARFVELDPSIQTELLSRNTYG